MIPFVLRIPAVRRLVAAYAINQAGDWAGEMALAVAVFEATGKATAVAATWFVHRTCLSLLAPAFAARLESRSRPRVLTGLYLLQATLFSALVVVLPQATWAALPILAVDGLLAPAARALARTSLVAITQPRGLLRETNAIVNVVFTFNGVLAPVLGALLVATVGIRGALEANVATFLVAAALVRGLALPASDFERQTGRERVAAALRFARMNRVIGVLLAGDAVYWVFVAAITPIEVVFVCGTLGAETGALGVVLAAWGAGMVAGGIAAARARAIQLPALLALAAAAPALACLGMGASSSVGQVVVWSAIGGLGNGAYGMAFLTALQERTPAAHQLCVNALYETVGSVAPGLGFILGGLLAAAASPRAVYMVAGAGALAAIGVTAVWLRGADWSHVAPSITDPGV